MGSRRGFLKGSLAGGAAFLGCSSEGGTDDADAGATTGADAGPDAGPDDGDVVDPGDVDADPTDASDGETTDADDTSDADVEEPPECADPFEGGELVGRLEWLGEGTPVMNTPYNEGLDGRLAFDLSNLTKDDLITPVEHFYIRTRVPDQLDLDAEWMCAVNGLVEAPFELSWADFEPHIQDMGVHEMECSGNGANSQFGLLSAC